MLTQEQKQQILNSPNFQTLVNKPIITPQVGSSFVERARQARSQAPLPVAPTVPIQNRTERIIETGTEVKTGIFESIKNRAKKIGESLIAFDVPFTKKDDKIRADIEQATGQKITSQGAIRTSLQIGAEGVLALGDSVFEIIKGIGKGADDLTSGKLAEKLEPGTQAFLNDVKSFVQTAPSGFLSNVRQENPELATSIETKVNEFKNKLETDDRLRRDLDIPLAGLEAMGWKATKPAREAIKEGVEKSVSGATRAGEKIVSGVSEVAETVKQPITKGYNIVKTKVEDLKGKSPVAVVTEKIKPSEKTLENIVSPRFNISEKSKAIREKRVKAGSDYPTLGKAPDFIEPSKDAKKIADTVRKYVDDADRLDQFEIVERVDNTITTLAKEIRPVLKDLNFTPQQRKELFSEWEFIKNKQKKSIFYDTKTSVKKFQDATENFLKQVNSKVKDTNTGQFRESNMNDLWDFRIAYDNLADVKRIKKMLKKADLSGEEQLLIDMWRQNRDILNQFIKDSANAMGDDVGSKWLDMSNMYEVIDNISLKGDIDLTGEPDVIRRFLTIPTKITR